MKILKIASIAFALSSFPAFAQNGLIGFANYSDMGLLGTTGGAGGRIVHVDNRADFEKYCKASEPYIIILDADLKGFYDYSTTPKQKHDVVTVTSNKTIIGGGAGAHLDMLGLDVKDAHNIIIRNLRITKADPDAIAFRNSHHIWVDHCDLSSQKEENEANDGLLDFTYGSSYLTVSWCRFHDHDKSSICSSGTRNIADYGRQRVTYHHNAFINCTQRNPRIGYGMGHIFNDVNERNTSYAIGFFGRARVNVENSYFKDCRQAFSQMYSADYGDYDTYWGFVSSRGNVFSNSGSTEGNIDFSFNPEKYYDHSFAMHNASELPGLLDRMGCVPGLEKDFIPFPGNGARGIKAGTAISCSDLEGATAYSYKIGTSAEELADADPATFGMAPATTYYWTVTATFADNTSATSEVFRFTTAPAEASWPVPADREAHFALRDISDGTKFCTPSYLTWEPTFDATGYTVYISDRNDMADARSLNVPTNRYQLEDAEFGRTYWWRVDANRADGSVVAGPVWSFSSDVAYANVGLNEAEDAVRGGLCFLEYHDSLNDWIPASGGRTTVGDEGPGCLSFVWDGADGTYDVATSYFDEKSGQSRLALYVNEKQIDSWTASKNKNTMEVRTSQGVALSKGDEVRIDFITNKTMRTRVDCINVKAASGIDAVEADRVNADKRVFGIDGRYFGETTEGLPAGLYIVGGKKIIIR